MFSDLDQVRIKGSDMIGTIVHVYKNGEAYEVEFPNNMVIPVLAEDIEST